MRSSFLRRGFWSIRRSKGVAIPFKWGQVSYDTVHKESVKNILSQSLLNEVKFPTRRFCNNQRENWTVAIPFKWGQVSYSGGVRVILNGETVAIPFKWGQVSYKDGTVRYSYATVAIPFKWGQVSYLTWVVLKISALAKSQSLLNEVKFPTLFLILVG